jgi:glyoxylase-like metal-dependent hydrolase (beta-lactamase superfamily II)
VIEDSEAQSSILPEPQAPPDEFRLAADQCIARAAPVTHDSGGFSERTVARRLFNPGSELADNDRMPLHKIAVILALSLLASLAPSIASAQGSTSVGQSTTKVSDHVWTIIGFPNIGIIIGQNATLVVDTGLGPRNGAAVAAIVGKISHNSRLYLTTTHFHPEHAAGEPGFPPGTILIRNAVQQEDMRQHGEEMLSFFRDRSPQNKELLTNVRLREPDIIFNKEATINLGGVSTRLMWLGEAHTKGDELILVEPDRTLISGDVVQNKTIPGIFRDGGTPASWLAVLDQLVPLHVAHVLPDHSAPGPGSLVEDERAFIADVQTRAMELKRQGVSAEAAGKQIATEFKTKYPDWPNIDRVSGFVQRVWDEK